MNNLVREEHPDIAEEFRHSDQWFAGFCKRKGLSLRRKTHFAQKTPDEVSSVITSFHRSLLQVRKRGTYQLKGIANMDQTPLPFILTDNKTYETTGSQDVFCISGRSGLDKRQCSVQLTVFADGVPRVRPLLIFRGKGMRIKDDEKKR